MNKLESYFIIKKPNNNSKSITENELVHNINELLQKGMVTQLPINLIIGKGYSYQDVKSNLEIDGFLNVIHVKKRIVSKDKETVKVESDFSILDSRPFLSQDSSLTIDEVYGKSLTRLLTEAIENHHDLTSYLSALQEYNDLTQPQKNLEQGIRNSL